MSVTTTSLAPRGGSLGVSLAAHLLRRASFRLTKPRVDQFANMTANAAVNNLFNTAVPAPYIPRPLDYRIHAATGGEWIDDDNAPVENETNRRQWVAGWWFRNALNDPSATHKLAFFIHTFFTISYPGVAAGVHASRYIYDHLALLNYAADNGMDLKTLAKKMTFDNAMLYYLNNRQNRKTGVNENYAREFLELFTVGRGEQISEGVYTNYTEADITELARILTGFTTLASRNDPNVAIDADTGIRTGYIHVGNHDTGSKTFSDRFLDANGNTYTITGGTNEASIRQEFDEVVDMVFAQTETARNYARKMYRFYVNTEIDNTIENTVITELTNHLINNGYDLTATLKMLLKSQHFYSMCAGVQGGGNLIKSPIELLTEAMSFFNTDLPALSTSSSEIEIEEHYFDFVTRYLINTLGENAGLRLFGPLSVAGYPAYYQEPLRDKNWYNGSTIPSRYGIGSLFVTNQHWIDTILHTHIDSVAFANYLLTLGIDVADADAVVNAVVDYLLPQTLTPDRMNVIKNIFLDDLSPINWQCEWAFYNGGTCAGNPVTPDGDENRVRPHLDALIIAVLSSQEFQLK